MSIVPITILSHYLAKIFLYFVFWLAKLEYNTISKIMKAICISISILFVIALLSPTRCRRGGPRTPRRQCLFNQMQLFGGHEFFYMDKGYYLSFHSLQDLEVLTKEHYMSEIPKCPEVSGDNISYYLGHDKTICCVIHGCRK
ncbi:MAG: hypothetical protein KC646_00005 [Candidatus Cloacimonetes bacterium]|nr:hypothetical protein [Candidatus Cloacimonadota bacterium]